MGHTDKDKWGGGLVNDHQGFQNCQGNKAALLAMSHRPISGHVSFAGHGLH